jgi:hypothetical protein
MKLIKSIKLLIIISFTLFPLISTHFLELNLGNLSVEFSNDDRYLTVDELEEPERVKPLKVFFLFKIAHRLRIKIENDDEYFLVVPNTKFKELAVKLKIHNFVDFEQKMSKFFVFQQDIHPHYSFVPKEDVKIPNLLSSGMLLGQYTGRIEAELVYSSEAREFELTYTYQVKSIRFNKEGDILLNATLDLIKSPENTKGLVNVVLEAFFNKYFPQTTLKDCRDDSLKVSQEFRKDIKDKYCNNIAKLGLETFGIISDEKIREIMCSNQKKELKLRKLK